MTTRRHTLLGMLGMVPTLGVGRAFGNPEVDVEDVFELRGAIPGWEGVAPADIEGEVNPTLHFRHVGASYRVVWENADGGWHVFVIRDEHGNALVSSRQSAAQGEVIAVDFEAAPEMDHYVCVPHPDSMVGDIVVGDDAPPPDVTAQADLVLDAIEGDGGTYGWRGRHPKSIEDAINPTLSFEDSRHYTIGLVNRTDVEHTFVLVAHDDTVVNPVEVIPPKEAMTVTVEPDADVGGYRCARHPDDMAGDVEVRQDSATDDVAPDSWETVEEIFLRGETTQWTGVSPSIIEGRPNPTLEFHGGETYAITWENADGTDHNLAIREGDGTVWTATEFDNAQGRTHTLIVEADPWMAAYACEHHSGTMDGDIVVHEEDAAETDDLGVGDDAGRVREDDVHESDNLSAPESVGDGADDAGTQDAGSGDDGEDDGLPGFGPIAALGAILTGGALAVRRRLELPK